MNSILILLLIGLGIFIIHKIKSKFKVPKIGAMVLFSGGVKCGKSTLAVATAISEYKRRVRRIKFRNFFSFDAQSNRGHDNNGETNVLSKS